MFKMEENKKDIHEKKEQGDQSPEEKVVP